MLFSNRHGCKAELSLLISQHLPEEEMQSLFSLMGRFQPLSSFRPHLSTKNKVPATSVVKKAVAPEVRVQFSQELGIQPLGLGGSCHVKQLDRVPIC